MAIAGIRSLAVAFHRPVAVILANPAGVVTDLTGHGQSSRLAEFGGRGMSFNICRDQVRGRVLATGKMSKFPDGLS
jgi:hypothetical protein